MKVLFITDYLAPSMNGIAIYSENTIRCLKKSGCEVVTFGPKGCLSADHWLPTLDFTRTIFCFPNSKLAKEVLFGKYDVVHINCPSGITGYLVCLLAKIARVAVIYFNHGNIATYCKFNFKSLLLQEFFSKFAMFLFYTPFYLFKPVIVQNPGCSDLSDGSKKWLNFHKGTCGADLELFTFSPSYEKYHLVSVGRLSLEKNWEKLISLFAQLPRRYRLTIIGEGPLERQLKKQCKELGLDNVTFTGKIKQEEVCSYLQKAQGYISASLFETWGLTLVEALACGTPIIYPNANPFNQLYKKELAEGAYEIEDSSSFMKAVIRTEEADEQTRKKCNLVAQQFSWEKATGNLIEIYSRSISNPVPLSLHRDQIA